MTPDCGRALRHHDLADAAEPACLPVVTRVDREPGQRDNAGGIEHCGRVRSVLEYEPTLEDCPRLGEPSCLEEQSTVPGLEHLVSPGVPIALRGRKAVGRDREGFVVAIVDA